jgi:hypothetical protein
LLPFAIASAIFSISQMAWERRGYVAAAAALVALAVAGCGGSETAAEELPRLPKAQLIEKGEAICDQGNEVINARFDRWGQKNTAAGRIASQKELGDFTAKVVLPIRKTELRRLRALGTPHPGAQTYRRILAAMEEGIETGERDHLSMQSVGDDYAFAKAFDLSILFGLKSCWVE